MTNLWMSNSTINFRLAAYRVALNATPKLVPSPAFDTTVSPDNISVIPTNQFVLKNSARNITKMAKHMVYASDVLLLLKDLGVVQKEIGEIVQNKQDELIYNGVDSDRVRQVISWEIYEAFDKAYPGELQNFNSFAAWGDPSFMIHEVLHLTIDPDHDLQNFKTSKGPVESAFDEAIINLIELSNVGPTPAVYSAVLTDFYEATEQAKNLGEYFQMLSSESVKDDNKARLMKESISYVQRKYKDKLEHDLTEEVDGRSLRSIVGEDLVDRIYSGVRDYVSYMDERREARFKKFLRLLKHRLDKIDAKSAEEDQRVATNVLFGFEFEGNRVALNATPKLVPGPAFHLEGDGKWDVQELPKEALQEAAYIGNIEIEGYPSVVFEMPDGSQWAQKEPGIPAPKGDDAARDLLDG